MTQISKLLDILATGLPEEYKKAKKDLWHLWHTKDGRSLVENSANEVFAYIEKFDDIKDINNKKAFIAGLSLFYLVLSDEYFEKLKVFTLKTIQNPDGHIREAIKNTSDWLFPSLSERMKPFTYPKGKKLTKKQKVDQIVAKKQYLSFIDDVEDLLNKYHLKENERVKYIERMSPSVEKSVQMLWSRLVDLSKHCIQHPKWVLEKREEIKEKLQNIHAKYLVNFNLKDIEDEIFYESSYKDMTKLLSRFKKVNTITGLNEITQVINDAWNYFPHRSLVGLSPVEKRLEYLN